MEYFPLLGRTHQQPRIYFARFLTTDSVFYFLNYFLKYNLLSSQLTYGVYRVLLTSGVDSHDSSLTYNTQCSSQQVPSSMPITYFPLLPPHHQLSVCSLYLRVSYSLPPSLFETIFSFPFPQRLLFSFSRSTYE